MSTLLSVEAKRLLAGAIQLRQSLLHTQGDEAPNFNLFRILGVDAREVSTHSAFLGHLLSPSATHAQGDLFLRAFLLQIVQLELPPADDWVTTRELAFSGGRLDIVLRSATAKVIIVIENKIDAQDSEGQLRAYRQWLDAPLRRRMYQTRRLLYLTPNGAKAKHAASIDYQAISYVQQIANWLSDCRDQIKPPGLKGAINSYLRTIVGMNAKASTNDDLDEKIMDLIHASEGKETQIAALRIARVAKSLREELLKTFWTAGLVYLQKKCDETGLEQWLADPYGEGSYQEKRGIVLRARDVPKGKPHPLFSFNQHVGGALFRWEWGVKLDAWTGKVGKVKALPEARKCTAMMEALMMPGRRGWEGYRVLTDDASGIDRTLEAELAKGTEISEYFEEGWKTFQQLEPHLRLLHRAILRGII